MVFLQQVRSTLNVSIIWRFYSIRDLDCVQFMWFGYAVWFHGSCKIFEPCFVSTMCGERQRRACRTVSCEFNDPLTMPVRMWDMKLRLPALWMNARIMFCSFGGYVLLPMTEKWKNNASNFSDFTWKRKFDLREASCSVYNFPGLFAAPPMSKCGSCL